jgi:hypothetical protein
MSGKWTVIALGIVLLGLVLAGFTPLTARPGAFDDIQSEQVGRYTVVKVVESAGTMNILLLDTVTGDLYRATADDAKPYRERPRHGGFWVPKDKDLDFFKDKDKEFKRFKDKSLIKDGDPLTIPKDPGRVEPIDIFSKDKAKDAPKDTGRFKDSFPAPATIQDKLERKDGFRKDEFNEKDKDSRKYREDK